MSCGSSVDPVNNPNPSPNNLIRDDIFNCLFYLKESRYISYQQKQRCVHMLYAAVDKRKNKFHHIGYFGNLSLPRMSCPSMDIIMDALSFQNGSLEYCNDLDN